MMLGLCFLFSQVLTLAALPPLPVPTGGVTPQVAVKGLCGNEINARGEESQTSAKIDSKERPRFALIVGIDRYKSESIPATPGSARDATLMKEVLVGSYGFKDSPSNIRTLITEEATRARIISEFCNFLVAGAKANADKKPIAVFYFSGHGTRYANQERDVADSDAADGWDEAVVPFDSRDAGVYDILDDEIDDLSAELAEYSSDILFIFDSCHSGTVTRSDEVAREAPPNPANDKREEYVRRFPPSDVDRRRAEKIVTLAAALPHEKAYPKPDLQNGSMTFELAAAMRRATSTTTYRDLMREVRASVQASGGAKQTPFADGDELRPVLGESSSRADASFPITGGPSDGKIRIGAGSIHGVKQGAMLGIYSESATRLRGKDGFITYASVQTVGDRESVATLPKESENSNAGKVTPKSRVVLASPTFGGEAIALILDDPSVSATRGGIEPTLAEVGKQMTAESNPMVQGGLIEIVGQSKLKNLPPKQRPSRTITVKRGRFGTVFSDTSTLRLPAKCFPETGLFPKPDTDVFYLEASSPAVKGKPSPVFGEYFPAEDPSTPDRIVRSVSVYARQLMLLNLENSVSSLNDLVEVELEGLPIFLESQCQSDARKLVGWNCSDAAGPVAITNSRVRKGQAYRIRVKNVYMGPPMADLFVAVFIMTTDGKVQIVNRDSLASPLTSTKPLEFTRVATQPAGGETVKVVITTNKNDLEGLKLMEGITTRSSSEQSPLEKLLVKSGTRSAGDTSLSPSNPDSWGVKTMQISILAEKFVCSKGRPLEVTPR